MIPRGMELEMVPVLCHRALDGGANRGGLSRWLGEARVALEARRQAFEARHGELCRAHPGRRDRLRIQSWAERRRLEFLHLKASLEAVARWLHGGREVELRTALIRWEAARKAFQLSLKELMAFAPESPWGRSA